MKNKSFFDRVFPKKYNFYALLVQQCVTTYDGIHALESWIKNKKDADYNAVFMNKDKADEIRFRLEKDLTEAFSTPFDRQDMYSISVEISKIINCIISIQKTIRALKIETDAVITGMAAILSMGAMELSEAISILEKNPSESQGIIEKIRMSESTIEDIYIQGLSELYEKHDAVRILKYREVYNYFKEAAKYLDDTVDIYHRICVRLI